MKNKPPKQFMIFKILGFTFLFISIILIILSATVLTWGYSPNFALLVPGMFILVPAISMIIWGFIPNIQKFQVTTMKYFQEENQDDLEDIATTSVEIHNEAITKTASAVKKGLQSNTMYCKHCGAEIDFDSKFCSQCGKELK